MKSVMKIFGILACVLLICMSTASATILPKKTAFPHAKIVHNETFTLHPGQSKIIILNETSKYSDRIATLKGFFGKEFRKELKSKEIDIIPAYDSAKNRLVIIIKAKQKTEGQITVKTYRKLVYGFIDFMNPLEEFNIKINVV